MCSCFSLPATSESSLMSASSYGITTDSEGCHHLTILGHDVIARFDRNGHSTMLIRKHATGSTFTYNEVARNSMIYAPQPQLDAEQQTVVQTALSSLRCCGLCAVGTCCFCTAASCTAAVALGQAVSYKANSLWNNWRRS